MPPYWVDRGVVRWSVAGVVRIRWADGETASHDPAETDE
jgi:hypothetical protein